MLQVMLSINQYAYRGISLVINVLFTYYTEHGYTESTAYYLTNRSFLERGPINAFIVEYIYCGACNESLYM